MAKYGGNRTTYLRIGISKVVGSDFCGVILDAINYDGGINQIGIPPEGSGREIAPYRKANKLFRDRN